METECTGDDQELKRFARSVALQNAPQRPNRTGNDRDTLSETKRESILSCSDRARGRIRSFAREREREGEALFERERGVEVKTRSRLCFRRRDFFFLRKTTGLETVRFPLETVRHKARTNRRQTLLSNRRRESAFTQARSVCAAKLHAETATVTARGPASSIWNSVAC